MADEPENQLDRLAGLLRERNRIDAKIADLIGRPAERGHIGEWIAARIFGIELHARATRKGSDGTFKSGPLVGREVNVKMYGYQEGLLDTKPVDAPEFYLVLTGPRRAAASSRGTSRPLVIEQVYLFPNAGLLEGGLKPGVAASVRKHQWQSYMIYPEPGEKAVILLDERQTSLLRLFTMRK